MSTRVLVLAIAVALAEAAAAVALVLSSNHDDHKLTQLTLALTAGLSFIVAGLVAINRRPENRTGLYLAGVGYLWFLGALNDANSNTVYTFSQFVGSLAFIPFTALVLAFPTGRLAPRPDRLIVRFTAAFILVFAPLFLLFAKHPSSCRNCGDSVIVLYESHTVERIVLTVTSLIVVGLIVAVVGVLFLRWRRASKALRRILFPVYAAGAAALFLLLLGNLSANFSTGVSDALAPVFLVLFAAVPFAFLFGILRSHLARGSVARLVVAIGEGTPLRDAIAEALGDPSVELAYAVERGTVRRPRRPKIRAPATGLGSHGDDGRA